MATIDYAKRYSGQVVEKFTEGAKSNGVLSNEFDFSGVKSVLVYNLGQVTLQNYNRTATGDRFGTPDQLDARTEELTMTQEKSFTAVIDKLDMDETMMALEAGKVLNRTIKDVIVPHLDTYRFNKMVEVAKTKEDVAITKDNAYEQLTIGNEKLDELEIPAEGRTAYVTPKMYRFLKNSKDVILDVDISQEQRAQGVLGLIDGLQIVKVPSTRFPANVNFIISGREAVVAPVKLAVYRALTEVPGLLGTKLEGLVYHDCFILEERKKALYVCSEPVLMSAKAKAK